MLRKVYEHKDHQCVTMLTVAKIFNQYFLSNPVPVLHRPESAISASWVMPPLSSPPTLLRVHPLIPSNIETTDEGFENETADSTYNQPER